MKGNKQKAKYTEPERRHGKPGRKEGEEDGERKQTVSTGKASCEAKTGRKWKRKNRRLSSQNRAEADERKRSKGKARRRKQKGSTGGTAVGAKPGGMKGNKQRAEYLKTEGKHGKPGGTEVEKVRKPKGRETAPEKQL